MCCCCEQVMLWHQESGHVQHRGVRWHHPLRPSTVHAPKSMSAARAGPRASSRYSNWQTSSALMLCGARAATLLSSAGCAPPAPACPPPPPGCGCSSPPFGASSLKVDTTWPLQFMTFDTNGPASRAIACKPPMTAGAHCASSFQPQGQGGKGALGQCSTRPCRRCGRRQHCARRRAGAGAGWGRRLPGDAACWQ